LILLGVLLLAFIATVSKMATQEIPWVLVPMFAIPIALIYFFTLALAGLVLRKLGLRWGVYTFPALAVVMGWMQYTYTPASSWGILAHTQDANLPLIQFSSLTGVGGITFLVALGSALSAAIWIQGYRSVRVDVLVFLVLISIILSYGQWRLGRPAPGERVLIGGVVSPVTHREFAKAYRDINYLRAFDDELFARTKQAVNQGARIVVWNENATLINMQDEAVFSARGQSLARQNGIFLLMAYGVIESMRPFHYIDKYRIYTPVGLMADEYIKRFPVPADPNTPGKAHAKVLAINAKSFSGAICYDYGFPIIAWDNANEGAGLSLVPSSDWRGIDPQHALMARMNAVAVGLPMVRPVRAATSIFTDQYGRILGMMRVDEGGSGVLVAAVPLGRVHTVYAVTGELFPLLCLLFCVFVTYKLIIVRIRHGN